MKKLYKYLYALTAIVFMVTSANGQLIFKEDFDYPAGNLEGKSGGTGFTTAWSKATTNTNAALIGADSKAQILAGSIATTGGVGNRVRLCIDSGKTVRLDRTIPLTLNGANGTTYWFGFWYRSTTDTSSVAGATNTTGIGAQIIFLSNPNVGDVTAQRLQFGKQAVGGTVNAINIASRSEGCTATGAGSGAPTWGTGIVSKGTYYILTKIIKGDSVGHDGIRMWVLSAPPANEAALSANGNIGTPNGRVLLKSLRADNPSFCVADGIKGIRIRVEGTGNTGYCVEFDDMRLGRTLASVLSGTSPVKDIAADYFSINLAPNPASEMSIMELKMKKAGKADIGVFDITGKRVATIANGFYTEGVHTVEIKTANIPAGIYFVKTQLENSFQQTTKLIVAK
jgi:hypothetical protein